MEGHRIMEDIEQAFKEKVSDHIKIMSEGEHRYRVFTPFMFADGDHFSIILKKEDEGWVLSDEGHTLMHLSIDQEGNDSVIQNRGAIASALAGLGVKEINRELMTRICDKHYGDFLDNFVRAIRMFAGGGKDEKYAR